MDTDNVLATAKSLAAAIAAHIDGQPACDGARTIRTAEALGTCVFVVMDNSQTFRIDVIRGAQRPVTGY